MFVIMQILALYKILLSTFFEMLNLVIHGYNWHK